MHFIRPQINYFTSSMIVNIHLFRLCFDYKIITGKQISTLKHQRKRANSPERT